MGWPRGSSIGRPQEAASPTLEEAARLLPEGREAAETTARPADISRYYCLHATSRLPRRWLFLAFLRDDTQCLLRGSIDGSYLYRRAARRVFIITGAARMLAAHFSSALRWHFSAASVWFRDADVRAIMAAPNAAARLYKRSFGSPA